MAQDNSFWGAFLLMKLEHKVGVRAVIIGLVVFQFVVILLNLLCLKIKPEGLGPDVQFYYNYSLELMRGQLPYRHFSLEYPPLALLPFVLPRLVTFGQPLSFAAYTSLFVVQNALFSTLVALMLVHVVSHQRLWPRPALVLSVYVLLVIICDLLVGFRYDLFPALLTLLSLLSVLVDRPTLAGLWLGLGVVTKIYPIVLLPIFSTYYLAGRRYRALLRLLSGSVGAIGLILLPFFLVAPGRLFSFLQYHLMRGLQIESLPAGVISLVHVLGLAQAKIVNNYNADHIVSPLADIVLKWLPFVFILVFGVVLASCLRRFQDEHAIIGAISTDSLVAYIVAALLTFICTNKVFSPQYMIWLLPFAPLLRRRQVSLLIAIFTITAIIYPFGYKYLLRNMHPTGVLLLNLRNILLVSLLLWLLIERLPGSMHIALVKYRRLLSNWFPR